MDLLRSDLTDTGSAGEQHGAGQFLFQTLNIHGHAFLAAAEGVGNKGPADQDNVSALGQHFEHIHSVPDTTWDAFREEDGTWVARVSWTAGLSENEAEWSIHGYTSPQSTAEARNPVAADLTDPDFVQPVRTLTSVGRGSRYEETVEDSFDDEDTRPTSGGPGIEAVPDEIEGEDTDRAPEERPTRRRRKAVTPHWEDVLLGVRTNTKRPRS